jgi:hypothetical protein
MTVAGAAEGNRGVRTQGFAGLLLTHADVTLDVGQARHDCHAQRRGTRAEQYDPGSSS